MFTAGVWGTDTGGVIGGGGPGGRKPMKKYILTLSITLPKQTRVVYMVDSFICYMVKKGLNIPKNI